MLSCKLIKDSIKLLRSISSLSSSASSAAAAVASTTTTTTITTSLSNGLITDRQQNYILNNKNNDNIHQQIINFLPQSISLGIDYININNNNNWNEMNRRDQRREIRDIIINPKVIENPLNDKRKMDIFEMPQYHKNIIIELPTTDTNQRINNDDGYQAAVLIGIRRRKMKKHKLKKLRKKMKFEWAKVRQRREVRKEKAFQAEILAIVKGGDKFSAEKYVEEKLRKANEIPIPRFWKGKRLPQFIIKEKLGMK